MHPPYDHERPQTAFVAGGTGPLGRALVDVLLQHQQQVCVGYHDERGAEPLRAEQTTALADGRLRLSRCDASDPDQVAALLDVLRADWGPLWLACSTVGGWAGGTPVSELDDLALFDRMYSRHLRSAAAVAREGLRHMGPQGGRVVLVSARSALSPSPGEAAYAAAKAGLTSLVASLAAELRGSGRTANAVVPKIIDTPANRRAMPTADHERWVPSGAIAKVIAWLASAESWPVSGAMVPVYGDS